MKPFIYAYNNASESAQLLAKSLNTSMIRHERSRFRPSNDKVIVNWGASIIPLEIMNTCDILNHPVGVDIAKNKLKTFKAYGGIPHDLKPRTVPWTEDPEVARSWQTENRATVVVRHILNGHEGNGIELIEPDQELPLNARLYTKYIRKEKEFRCHVFQEEIIDIQQKVRNQENNNGDFRIRNWNAGFRFARTVNGLPVAETIPQDCKEHSIRAVKWLGLDWGAVDVLWNAHSNKAYVCEVNTAPGIEGTTLEKYSQAIRKVCNWNG